MGVRRRGYGAAGVRSRRCSVAPGSGERGRSVRGDLLSRDAPFLADPRVLIASCAPRGRVCLHCCLFGPRGWHLA